MLKISKTCSSIVIDSFVCTPLSMSKPPLEVVVKVCACELMAIAITRRIENRFFIYERIEIKLRLPVADAVWGLSFGQLAHLAMLDLVCGLGAVAHRARSEEECC